MKSYYATGDRMFKTVESESTAGELVRLKLSLIYPTLADVAVFEGKLGIDYPRIPCRLATAVLSEDREELGLKLGSRVLLNPYVDPSSEDDVGDGRIYGVDEDGFLRDFIAVNADSIVPFPENVKEEEALFADIVAVALRVLGTFRLQKGDYVAIVGGSLLGVVVAQLALYYQAIPVLISSDERYLKLAEGCGVYYTVDELRDNVTQKLMSITGGRMADHTVLHAVPNIAPNFIHMLTASGGDCVIAGLNGSYLPKLEADISAIAAKNLTVKGVTNGKSEFNAAINLLAQKILKFDGFIDKTVPLADVQKLFEELASDAQRYVAAVVKV